MRPTIRPLEAADWERFRDIRLFALRTERGVFSSSYEREVEFAPEEWQKRLVDPGQRAFGLFDDAVLIGITGVVTAREDRTASTALLVMSYIRPEHRGQGLSALFYEARLDWIKAQPQFSRVLVSHRESNEASRRANQRYGFAVVHRVPRSWPDGTTEDEVFYELPIVRER
jgi:RimJ/RimL family protein N-acetyltransferase